MELVLEPDRKSRMISFRLSHPQYETLKKIYRQHGARSVSEFAREAMERLIADLPNHPLQPQSLHTRYEALAQRVDQLRDDVDRLTGLLKSQ